MRGILLLMSLLGVACALTTPALAVDVPALIAAAPPASEFPDHDIVVLYQAETIGIDADGRITRHVHTVRRLQTQWAMRRQADVRIAWNTARQELEGVRARTFMRDGDIRETPDNGYNEVTPGAVARAVPFMDIRELVVSHIGTEPGCVVELEYTVRDREPPATAAQGVCWLGGEYPVLRAECEVTGPGLARAVPFAADRALSWTEEAGRGEIRDVPALAEVPHDQWRHAVPHVVWTAQTGGRPDRSAFAASVRTASKPAMVAGAHLKSWLATTREESSTLTDGDLLNAIAALIHDGIAAVAPPTGQWSRAPRPADAVFTSAVGTAWERALVATALLREAGFAPELGLFARHEGLGSDLARPSHLRVVARVGEENWWLAPDRGEAWTGRCDLGGYYGIFLAGDGSQRAYQVRDEPLGCRWLARVAPDGDGWLAEADLELTGLAQGHDDPRAMAERLAGRLLDNGEIGHFELRHSTPASVAMRFSVTGDGLAAAQDGLIWYERVWPADVSPAAVLGQVDLDRAERTVPIHLAYGVSLRSELVLEVPEGWRIDHPAFEAGDGSSGPLTVQCDRQNEPRRVRRTVQLELEPAVIAPDQWPAYRQAAMRAIGSVTRPEVVIANE